jgi:hypothetical protein
VGLRVDADRSVIGVWEVDDLGPLSGEPRDFLIIGGAEGSLWENRVFEEAFGQDSVSTIKILELAIDAGVTVYTRWNTLPLPANTQPLSVRQAIQNSILNGQEVTFPADPMTIGSPGTGEWTGTGWIDMDPSSGAAGYLISGGNNGGATVEFWPPEFIDLQEGDRTVVQVTIEITKPDNDSPDTDAIFTRANVQHLEFEYLVHVTYDDASMATLGPYKKTTRNTTKTFQPGNYTFKVWIARFIWWGVLAQAERKVSIVGVLIREDDGTEAGAAPPKLLCLKPAGQTPEVKKLKARVIPAKASDGTTDMGSMYAWSGGSKIMLNPTNTQAADASITGDQPSGSANDQPINVNVTLVDGKVVAGVAEFKFGAEQDKKHEMTALKAEIDGFVDGDMATAGRKIDNLVERGATATTDDDARVLTGGYVQFQLDLQPQNVETDPGLKLSFEWSASAGTLEEDKTRKDVKWDAPSGENSENALMLTAQIKNDGKLEGTKSATIKPVKPRVIRTKFVDDGSNNFINLLDEENSALIEAPQYDRLNLTWETASSHEAGQGDHKNEDSKVFKNESIAYVKGSKLRVLADLAARDAEGGTATEEKDLSAATPVRLKAVDSAPSLTFNTGAAFDVMDWSVKDYDAHAAETTLTSTETLGETGTKIRFYYETTLKWTIEVKDKTGAWVNALGGTTTWDTTHRSLCVANAKPIIPVYPVGAGAIITTANQAWEKVMQYSCDWAKGQGGAGAAAQKAIVDAQWAGIDQNDTSGTGARHNINYTFVGQPAFNTRDFAKAGCHGSCGHQARFFSDIGGAQGISVNIRSIALMPTAFGHATDLAVGVQDIDGDWREATYPAGPAAGGNPLWWFNAPVGVPNPTEHSATEFAGDIYDPTFGVKHTGTWNSYIASAVTLWFIRIDATTGAWKSKATVNADGNTVRWESFTNYASSGIVTWSPIP